MNYKKDFKKMQDTMIMGAGVMQASTLLGSNRSNPVAAIPGMVGIGVSGVVANASFRLASGDFYKRKKRR